MIYRNGLKRLSIRLGIYPLARRVYRRISPEVRSQLKDDKDIYARFIKPGSLVFDIGSNMGQKAQVFVDLGARTVALEPNPNCWKIIESELGSSKLVHLVRKAVGAVEGEAILTFSHTASTASLDPQWGALEYRVAPLERRTVLITTLDALIDEFGVPDFCKIDVEGFELEVIKGLSTPIPTLSLEYHRSDLDRLRDCLTYLSKLGRLEANVIRMNSPVFALEAWVPENELMEYLATEVAPPSGDVFVKMHN